MDEFYEWWSEQSPWARYGVAVFFIAVSIVQFLLSERFHYWHCAGLAIGIVLLLFAGPDDSEKKGYRF